MTDIDPALAAEAAVTVTPSRAKCKRHRWAPPMADLGETLWVCLSCPAVRDPIRSKRNRNNGRRGRAAELDAARVVNGRKVGPMLWPWDVEMRGYARLGVKKLVTPPSLRAIAGMLADIARTPGPEMPGVIWIEPGRDGQKLIVFRLRDFADRHGVPDGGAEE